MPGGVSHSNHEYSILGTDAINENEWKPIDRHVVTISPGLWMRCRISHQSFDGMAGSLKEALCGVRRPDAIPRPAAEPRGHP
jgi:hypothetical protein